MLKDSTWLIEKNTDKEFQNLSPAVRMGNHCLAPCAVILPSLLKELHTRFEGLIVDQNVIYKTS